MRTDLKFTLLGFAIACGIGVYAYHERDTLAYQGDAPEEPLRSAGGASVLPPEAASAPSDPIAQGQLQADKGQHGVEKVVPGERTDSAGKASDKALSWRDIEHPYAGAERKSQISLSRMAAMKGDKALLTDMLNNAQLSPQELLLVMNAAINGKGLPLVPDIAARGADFNGEGATRGALETMLLKGRQLDRETIEAARYLVSRGAVWKETSMAQLKDPSTQAQIEEKISQLARHGIQVSRIN